MREGASLELVKGEGAILGRKHGTTVPGNGKSGYLEAK